jgi:transposase
MSVRFVNIDHDTPLLLPPDLRDWVSEDHMVHFIMDAVKALDLSRARTNQRGTGHAQYPPSMMLGLLIYCYATGGFGHQCFHGRLKLPKKRPMFSIFLNRQ